ncbi:MAG: BACON domain-containing protein [Marinilabiliaceae bacterium]|nr:BACON domain-containing protein [Marinilabiliaceae bacterium]
MLQFIKTHQMHAICGADAQEKETLSIIQKVCGKFSVLYYAMTLLIAFCAIGFLFTACDGAGGGGVAATPSEDIEVSPTSLTFNADEINKKKFVEVDTKAKDWKISVASAARDWLKTGLAEEDDDEVGFYVWVTSENEDEEERSGKITVSAGETTASVTVKQRGTNEGGGEDEIIVETLQPQNVTNNSATLRGNIKSAGNPPYTLKGFGVFEWAGYDWELFGEFEVSGSGTGIFTYDVTGLKPNTEYVYIAVAANANTEEWGSGDEVSFTTSGGGSNITQVRFQKTQAIPEIPYMSVDKHDASGNWVEVIAEYEFGGSSGTSQYYDIPSGTWYLYFFYTGHPGMEEGYYYLTDPFNFQQGNKYTYRCFLEGSTITFEVTNDGPTKSGVSYVSTTETFTFTKDAVKPSKKTRQIKDVKVLSGKFRADIKK